jgi:hypothetical protein
MTQPTDSPYADNLTGGVSARLTHDLDDLYRLSTPSARLDATILPGLRGHGVNPSPRNRLWRVRLLPSRMAGIAVAFALVMASTLTYLHGQSPTSVSAQTILNRAVSAELAPDQVTHFTFRLTASNGYTGSLEEWIQADASGAPSRLALSRTVLENGNPVSSLDQRLVQSGNAAQVYDPASNTVTSVQGDQLDQPWETIIPGTYLAQKLSGRAQTGSPPQPAQKGNGPIASQHTLDGVSVYVVNLISLNADRMLYVDAQSYVVRGADWQESGVAWQARLLRYDTMPASDAPAGTFALSAPSTATVVPAQPDKSDYPVDLGSAFAQACNTTPATYKSALGAAADESMLAVCQQTNPTMTSDQLSAALLASAKTQLDAAAAAGSITAAQEADQLSRMQSKLGATITSPSGMSTPTPK